MAAVVFGPISPSMTSNGAGPPLAVGTLLSSSCTTRTSAARFLPPTPTADVIVAASGSFDGPNVTRRHPLSEFVRQTATIMTSRGARRPQNLAHVAPPCPGDGRRRHHDSPARRAVKHHENAMTQSGPIQVDSPILSWPGQDRPPSREPGETTAG